MPTYAYTAKDSSGTIKRGTQTAESEGALARKLRDQGMNVSNITEARGKAAPAGGAAANDKRPHFGNVKDTELSIFCRQFSTMMDAGIPLVRCLNVLQDQTTAPRFKRILNDVRTQVEAGEPLSRSLGRHDTFSTLFLGLIRAGEAGGALEESLQRLSAFLEANLKLKQKVKSAMTYPTIVAITAVIIVIGLVTFVLPKFMDLFTQLGMKQDDFPGMTRALMNASHFVTDGFPVRQLILIAVIAVLFFAFKKFKKTKGGKRIVDTIRLKIPVFGSLNHKLAISRFARTLATLLQSGVPILGALETVAGTLDNDLIADAVLEARSRIREGDRIGDPLAKSGMFPPMVVSMISIGEESGSLDTMLSKVAEFYEAEVDAALESLTAAIEPIMIVGMGVTVGFIVIAMFMPLVKVIENLSSGGAS